MYIVRLLFIFSVLSIGLCSSAQAIQITVACSSSSQAFTLCKDAAALERWMFHDMYSMLNDIFLALNIIKEAKAWTAGQHLAIVAIVIAAWKEFLFSLNFTLTNDMRTVPVAIARRSSTSQFELPWGNIMAASLIVTMPLLALVLMFQKYIISGLTAGTVKG